MEFSLMSVPPIPPLPEPMGHRPFSFYPPILNIEHNEWRMTRPTWSEMLVVNVKTGLEVWIPRRFLGEVSRIDEPVMIVGLLKELEYTGGAVWPHERRVIEMPRGLNAGPVPPPPRLETPAPIIGIRLEPGPERTVSRLIGAVLLTGVVASILVVAIARRPVSYHAIEQTALDFTADDDYHSVVRKLGPPSEDKWREGTNELQYRVLRYPKRSLSVILMGTDRGTAHYIGAMDKYWKPVHSVLLPKGGDTRAMLRGLPGF